MTERRYGATATLTVDTSSSRVKNREGYCVDQSTNYFYLFITDIGTATY